MEIHQSDGHVSFVLKGDPPKTQGDRERRNRVADEANRRSPSRV
jgi:hypothetical protein